MSRRSEWYEVAADAYLDARYRNWTLAEGAGDVVFVPARGVVPLDDPALVVALAVGGARRAAGPRV